MKKPNKPNKKLLLSLSLIFTFLFTLTISSIAFASQPIKLFLNDQQLNPPVPPQNINGTTMIPIRTVAEALNLNITYDQTVNSIYITSEKTNIENLNPIPVKESTKEESPQQSQLQSQQINSNSNSEYATRYNQFLTSVETYTNKIKEGIHKKNVYWGSFCKDAISYDYIRENVRKRDIEKLEDENANLLVKLMTELNNPPLEYKESYNQLYNFMKDTLPEYLNVYVDVYPYDAKGFKEFSDTQTTEVYLELYKIISLNN